MNNCVIDNGHDNEIIRNVMSDTFESLNGTEDSRTSKRVRRTNIKGKYSQDDFRALQKEEQIALLNTYLLKKPSCEFEDGTFQFSRSTLMKLAEELGYKKGFYRDSSFESDEPVSDKKAKCIFIDREKRTNTVEKKITLSETTNDKLEQLIRSGKRIFSKLERSKIIDAIFNITISEMLELQRKGLLKLAYRPEDEERLL